MLLLQAGMMPDRTHFSRPRPKRPQRRRPRSATPIRTALRSKIASRCNRNPLRSATHARPALIMHSTPRKGRLRPRAMHRSCITRCTHADRKTHTPKCGPAKPSRLREGFCYTAPYFPYVAKMRRSSDRADRPAWRPAPVRPALRVRRRSPRGRPTDVEPAPHPAIDYAPN